MTFKNWSKQFKDYTHPFGHLATDIQADKNFPNSESYKRIREYLEDMNASYDALKIFDHMWKRYQLYRHHGYPTWLKTGTYQMGFSDKGVYYNEYTTCLLCRKEHKFQHIALYYFWGPKIQRTQYICGACIEFVSKFYNHCVAKQDPKQTELEKEYWVD